MFPADRIRQLRKDNALTQTQLASRLGIDRTTLTKYETGERKPDVATLYKLADFFHVSLEYLTGRTSLPDSVQTTVALEELLHSSYASRVTLWGYKLKPEDKEYLTNLLQNLYNEWNA